MRISTCYVSRVLVGRFVSRRRSRLGSRELPPSGRWWGWVFSWVSHREVVAHELLPELGLCKVLLHLQVHPRFIPGAGRQSLPGLPAVGALQRRGVEIEKQLKEITAYPKASKAEQKA